jgi:SAM-dependent methyltransferase
LQAFVVTESRVDSTHYCGLAYDSSERFSSYWHQVDQIVRRSPKDVLEVGIGNGFLSRYLRHAALRVSTVDIAPALRPDLVGSVTSLPFGDGSFDLVCCYETLEHLPWSSFSDGLHELQRVARRWVLISLPDATPYWKLDVELNVGRRRRVRQLIRLPNIRPRRRAPGAEHHWEIGWAGTSREQVLTELRRVGLELEEELRSFQLPYHHYFSCSKATAPGESRGSLDGDDRS